MPNDEKPIFSFAGHWATGFDARMQIVVPGYNLMHRIAASFLHATIPSTSSILVIGAGTGTDVITLRAYNSEWQITGIDPSAEMLQIAREKIDSTRFHEGIRLECCKIEDFRNDTLYDVAVLSLVLQMYPDDGSKRELLQMVAQHIKREGRIVLIDTYGNRESLQFNQTVEALKIQTTQMGFTPDESEKDVESVRERFYLVSEQRIRSILSEAGFVRIEQIFHAYITGVWIAQLRGRPELC
jgi:tRNA (cmo5U34)-methyltransferase